MITPETVNLITEALKQVGIFDPNITGIQWDEDETAYIVTIGNEPDNWLVGFNMDPQADPNVAAEWFAFPYA